MAVIVGIIARIAQTEKAATIMACISEMRETPEITAAILAIHRGMAPKGIAIIATKVIDTTITTRTPTHTTVTKGVTITSGTRLISSNTT